MNDLSEIFRKKPATKFVIAMVEVASMAKKENRICSLYKSKFGVYEFLASFSRWDDWLFRAYPGGRMVLSVAGKKRLEEDAEEVAGG